MKFQQLVSLGVVVSFPSINARNDDQFNFRGTVDNPSGNGNDYGPTRWDEVTCDTLGQCLGFPNTWEGSISWTPDTNNCRWCPDTGNSCGLHNQSPINLKRDRAIPDGPNEKTCPDWHYMKYQDGTCTWEDLVDNQKGAVNANNFSIKRHALHIMQPLTKDGQLACENENGNRYPRADYSKGFPDWFHLAHTEITVPSVHTQEGKRYDAEIHLNHFYENGDIPKDKIGTIALFLEGVSDILHWEFLDKLICQFRESEEETRKECGLPSAPEYFGCRNPLRGRTIYPTVAPVPSSSTPVPAPVTSMPVLSQTLKPVEVTTFNTSAPTTNPTNDPYSMPVTESTKPTTNLDAQGESTIPTAPPTSVVSTSTYTAPPQVQCNSRINFPIICQSGGCCESSRSTTAVCSAFYSFFAESYDSACWYCCEEPKVVTIDAAQNSTRGRNLRSGDSNSIKLRRDESRLSNMIIPERLLINRQEGDTTQDHDVRSRKVFVEQDEQAYFDSLITPFREVDAMNKTARQERHLLNFDQIAYNAYEWMLAVKTEYYFRYEGTFTIPPCTEVVHWRVMKDPIRVHPDQIKELERLLAWRVAPSGSKFKECEPDTAGIMRPGQDGNAVDLNRPLQSLHKLHRMVFCECQDWRSKFIEDNQWCRKGTNTRLYETPYGFGVGENSNGTQF